MSSTDDEIRAQFDDLRAEDSARAPEFQTLWTEAAREASEPASRPRGRAVWWLAAASALIAASLLVQRARHRDAGDMSALADTVPNPNIASWTSPTAGLMRMSQQMTFTSPSIHQSVLDGVATAPLMQPNPSRRGGL